MMKTTTMIWMTFGLLFLQVTSGAVSICVKDCDDDDAGGDADQQRQQGLGAVVAASSSAGPTLTPTPTPAPTTPPSIVELARRNPQFGTLLTSMDAVGLTTALQRAEGPLTIFAPTDKAFAAMTGTPVAKWVQQPLVWKPQLIDLLTHHVVEDEELLSLELNQQPVGMEYYSAQGGPITITSTNPLQIEDIPVVTTDILGSNGVMHSIVDSPLLTPASESNLVQLIKDLPFLSTLLRLLDQANLLEMLESEGPFTLLAPTNEAFERVSEQMMLLWESDPELLLETLQFHIANGNYMESDLQDDEKLIPRNSSDVSPVNVKDILVGDTLASNGILHMVDRIQKLPETMAPTPTPAPNSLVGILQRRGEFSMLLDSLEKTDRLRDLQFNGPSNPFTVFAPKDSSFVTDLPEKFLDDAWQTHLINVLTYHIVRGNLYPSNFTTVGQKLPTLNFNSLDVTSIATTPNGVGGTGPVQVNNVNIIESIEAENGMIHVVDALLLPPSATSYVIDLYSLFPEFQTLLDRIGMTDTTATLSTEGPITVFSPVNGAFANLLNPNLYTISDDPEIWKQILLYHIVPGDLINYAGLIEEHTPDETLPPRRQDGLIVPTDVQGIRDDVMMGGAETVNVNVNASQTDAPSMAPSMAPSVTPPPLYTFEVTTLQGSNLTITVGPNSVGPANILFEDLLVKNGVVQVTDQVLIPPNVTLTLANPAQIQQQQQQLQQQDQTADAAAVTRGGGPQ